MTLKELQIFSSVYENQSISKAAERLYIAQPSLTRIIQTIESEAGAQLFKRTRDGLKPTVAGEIYMESAKKMIEMYRQLEISLAAVSSENKGKLTIGSNFFLGACVLPIVVSEFEKRFKNIELTIVEGNSTEIESEISKGIVDIGIIHMPVQSPAVKSFVVGQERFFIALPPDDALTAMAYSKDGFTLPYIDLKLAAKRNFILNHPNQRARQESERIFANAGFKPNIKFQTKNIQTISKLVGRGVGISLVPSSYITLFSNVDNPSYYNIEEDLNPYWPVAVIIAKNLPMTNSIKEFITICQEVLPTIYNF